MTMTVPSIDTGSLALRVAEDPARGGWTVLLVPLGQESAVAGELAKALRDIGTESVAQHDAKCSDDLLQPADETGVHVMAVLPAMNDSEWARLDRMRSRLIDHGRTILVLDQDAMNRLGRSAPNLHSWIGPSMWSVELAWPALTDVEKEERLAALRQWSGYSDQEIVTLAEQGKLPGDPEYAEWLVLIDRGDLIE